MFRASSAHHQEDTVVYMQHMVLSLSMRVSGGLSVHSSRCVPTEHHGQTDMKRIVVFRNSANEPKRLINNNWIVLDQFTRGPDDDSKESKHVVQKW